ncbi:MAG: GAF and ANTAR domain-containing protein [Ilumatobacteraceae bacterium]|nr:GAF and ANTAR domain-containing protein [Ilumatobacteraceae bacterium]
MARQFEVDEVLHELTDHACSILGAVGAGVSVRTDSDELRFVTATSERITAIERIQDQHQAGACVEAYRTGDVVIASSPGELDRWPHYRKAIEQADLATVVGIPLTVDGDRIGSVNVYDVTRTWSDDDLGSAQVLADIAGAYLLHAGHLAEARQLSTQLQDALDSRVIIEQAKGMLSRDHAVTVDRAFEMLRRHARSTNSHLRDVAERIVAGTLRLPNGE